MKLYAPIRLIVADDHELYRDGFSSMLNKQEDIELIGEAKNGEELIKITRLLQPDIIVADILMPVVNGVDATRIITTEFPHIGVIALSMSNEDNLLIQMMDAGAQGYLLKNAHKNEILEAIKIVYKGGNYYCNDTTTKITKILSTNPAKNKPLFSEKELAIITMICKELSSQQIADELKHSIRTIDSYRKKILKKMKVKNATGLVLYAIRRKLYDPDERKLQI
jgi:DNA-binding NarL/FixJ family response regulator